MTLVQEMSPGTVSVSYFNTAQGGGRVVLGNFELLKELGAGTFATTYLAKQHGSDRSAVVKIAHPHLMSQEMGELVRLRFGIEFRALTRFKHPNLVTFFMAGETDSGEPAIAMEYIDGRMFSDVLNGHAPLELKHNAQIFMQVASALVVVHSAGVVHRDVTPSNIMLTRDHNRRLLVKVLDFGVAQLDDTRLGRTLGPIGTLRYLAPELCEGEASSASDMFSLGSMLWWALTGVEFMRDINSLGDFLRRLEGYTPPDPRELAPKLPASIAKLVQRLLDADPLRRPTAEQFLSAWQRILGEAKLSRPSSHSAILRGREASSGKSAASAGWGAATSGKLSIALSRPDTNVLQAARGGVEVTRETGAFPSISPDRPRPEASRPPSDGSGSLTQADLERYLLDAAPAWLLELSEAIAAGNVARRRALSGELITLSLSLSEPQLGALAERLFMLSPRASVNALHEVVDELKVEYAEVTRRRLG